MTNDVGNTGLDLSGRIAVVTGAAGGIGWTTCLTLAQAGAAVVALARRVAEAPGPGHVMPVGDGEIWTAEADVTDTASVARAVDAAMLRYGRIDGLFANAGVLYPGETVTGDDQHWHETIAVNLTGVWNTVRAVAPAIRAGGEGGSIVINSSVNGERAAAGWSAYSASKFGVVGLAGSLAQELGPERIRVNCVLPTSVDTPMINNPAHTARMGGEAQQALYRSGHALPTGWIEAQDVADAVLWLMSDRSRYVTGASLPIDAGYLVKAPGSHDLGDDSLGADVGLLT
ncbi:SDR family oxidoreductase [Aeromicrobium senzhongii]|uniref:SDR family oxidoreductase n=1 Tax=Aeromicrobium senzhongii TaxID=2663859 RepID=A0ABX6ST17_9ACTN|nr:SDR family oxidoreductase [Aeromicrobium senzhongii]MTB89006.1 SDR family oxidoreductase [Aeromicrobium senzhongii]QNL93717.1 SDR family oxidoreductase [Aeromicrobium senzhongii]